MAKDAKFGDLLRLCVEHGKDAVIGPLEEYHRKLEWGQATLLEDPSTVRQGHRMTTILTKQAITLGKLKHMSIEDMKAVLNGK